MKQDQSQKDTRKTFQVFTSGYAENHKVEEEVLLPIGVSNEEASSIQINEKDEALYPIGVIVEDD